MIEGCRGGCGDRREHGAGFRQSSLEEVKAQSSFKRGRYFLGEKSSRKKEQHVQSWKVEEILYVYKYLWPEGRV